ncbi:P-loop containing nucleoside triphosphate hydrolase protein [Xylaria telfairii]|nr:P-loop containing nucleoside triphosphate hydrolase protein [Xylaria telfairii]
MDKYESIHGKDESSFDLTSTHRLPTVSAAQAFDDLKTGPRQFIHTGLEALDQTLAGVSFEDGDESRQHRGIRKGQIVEVWGPPASGKTTFAMQIAANTLQDGCRVVWVANFVYYSTPTLAHLIGLLCKPRTSSVPSGTSLVVIDGLSGLINRAFPKNVEPRQNSKGSNVAVRRLQVLQHLVSALQKLSATQDLLVVVLNQCATRMQVERSATITPAINASTWEQGIATRLVLFQDWTTADAQLRNIRLIGVQKNNGQTSPNGIGVVFPFEIYDGGLAELDLGTNQPSLVLATNLHRQKRKFNETGIEIADSEGEDYGWEDEDEAEMPDMPPQWQGSEDLLLGRAEEDDNLTAEMSEPEGSCEPGQQKHHNSP